MARLKVMTLNLWGFRGDWTARRDRLLLFLQNEEIDVLLLQEVEQRPWRMHQAEEIAYLTGYGMMYAPAHRFFPLPLVSNGLAILSRYPMTNPLTREVCASAGMFASGAGERRVTQRVELGLDSLSVVLYNTHFPLDPKARIPAAQRLWEQVAQEEAVLVIVGGDFNAPPSENSIAFLQGKIDVAGKRGGLVDAWHTAGIGPPETFPSAEPRARIDYLFYQAEPSVVVQEARVVGRRPVEMSDHAAVIATFSISSSSDHEYPFSEAPVDALEPTGGGSGGGLLGF
ncbi:MAG: endonuclease/exonuclease/phosphatase family protein [Armatimonadota bacterium]